MDHNSAQVQQRERGGKGDDGWTETRANKAEWQEGDDEGWLQLEAKTSQGNKMLV